MSREFVRQKRNKTVICREAIMVVEVVVRGGHDVVTVATWFSIERYGVLYVVHGKAEQIIEDKRKWLK